MKQRRTESARLVFRIEKSKRKSCVHTKSETILTPEKLREKNEKLANIDE
jgi:hypothetical protein